VNAFLSNNEPSAPDAFQPLLAQVLMEEVGEVDLLIRTGGEKRLSDFLLWESAYAELLFTDRMWPDFDMTDFDAALDEYNRRDRRFGEVATTSSHSAISTTPNQSICSNP
jgi:undecaprenyl diphosphate synthase